MDHGVYAGVDIGGTKTAVLLSSEPPALISRLEFPTRPEQGPQPALDLIVRGLRESLAAHGVPNRRLKAIGVSCGGPLNPETGVIQAPPNLWTWVDVPITSILEGEFGAPCALENDANAGAVAEHRFGAGKGTRNMVFLTMGTGLGAGIIADGRLYKGTSDSAGEIGHVRLTRSGPVGYHKAGSMEGWASGAGMAQVAARSAVAALKKGQKSALAECLHAANGITARQVGEAAQSGDALALQIIRNTGRRLGEGLAILVDILNPERIVIGGLAMRLGDLLLEPARQVMRREAIASSAAVCDVVPASLSENIGDVAALCVAMGMR
jgi:glucokinase